MNLEYRRLIVNNTTFSWEIRGENIEEKKLRNFVFPFPLSGETTKRLREQMGEKEKKRDSLSFSILATAVLLFNFLSVFSTLPRYSSFRYYLILCIPRSFSGHSSRGFHSPTTTSQSWLPPPFPYNGAAVFLPVSCIADLGGEPEAQTSWTRAREPTKIVKPRL